MLKTTLIFVISYFLCLSYVYAHSQIDKPTYKIEYVENVFILNNAVKHKDNLEIHLEQYSVDAQEMRTGNTALHSLCNQLEEVHQNMINHSQVISAPPVQENHTGEEPIIVSYKYLETEYEEIKEMIEYLIVRGASPYIKNNNGQRVIESKGFDLYVSYVLDTHSPNFDKTVYKVYLAGPEVFLPIYNKVSRFLNTQVLLFNKYHLKDSDYHIQGVFPPNESEVQSYSDYFEVGTEIYSQSRRLMNSSHAIIANMTQFKGSSMDVGTAYEIGEMVHAQKTVVGYYDEKIYHLHYQEEITTTQEPESYTEAINYKAQTLRKLEIPDNLLVIMATLSSEHIQVPSSSWEALFVLKSKLDNKTSE